MNTRLKVSETMDKDPLIESGSLTVLDAARRMRDRGVGSLLVYDEGLQGIVTERDILDKVVAEHRDPGTLSLSDIMSRDVITIDLQEDILDALRLMRQRRIRHLPVLKAGHLAGLVTERGISQVAPELLQIVEDWDHIARSDDGGNGYRPLLAEDEQPGYCEGCGNGDTDLHESNGDLLCEECLEQEPETTAV